ncbi:MAG: CDP-diacylglycerol--serine O-phosphatidyltransferase [Alphaproteobacteria bacterium]|nr:CDP-diacylglycerol--serine O-phosphatidyltransferase [Alphaproteobacteria bacterium]
MRVHRLPHFSVNRLVPNILTLLALCAGMTAMRFAMNGYFQAAVYAIIVAGIFDGLDGRIARLLKSTSRFGAELDSLSDFVSFGVAPASVLYLWTMSQLHSIGWAIVLFFAVCCALRLARFNTQLAEPPPYAAGFFSGAPAPAGAGLVMMPMFASFEWGDWIARSPYLSAVWISGVALLMISTVPTVSLKRIVRVPHHLVIPTLLGVGVATAFLTTAPWPTLTCVGLVYLGSIPLTVRAYYRLRHAAEARRAEPAETAARTASAAIPYSIGDSSPPANEWRH